MKKKVGMINKPNPVILEKINKINGQVREKNLQNKK